MITTLTWSPTYTGTTVGAATAATHLVALKSALDAASAAAGFPWLVCSSEMSATDTRYITLKRKSGGPGRILILAALTGTTLWNDTIRNSTSAPLLTAIVCCYIGGATSDAPANLRGSASPVFEGQIDADTSPCSPQILVAGASTSVYFVCGNEDYILYGVTTLLPGGALNSTGMTHAVGLMLVSVDDLEVIPGSMSLSNVLVMPHMTSPIATSPGIYTRAPDSSAPAHMGVESTVPSTFTADRGRDLATKSVFFYPVNPVSSQRGYGPSASRHQLRQLTVGPTALAPYEVITDIGGIVRARAHGAVLAGCMWLTEVKLNG